MQGCLLTHPAGKEEFLRKQLVLKTSWNKLASDLKARHKVPELAMCDAFFAIEVFVSEMDDRPTKVIFAALSDGAERHGRKSALQMFDIYSVMSGS